MLLTGSGLHIVGTEWLQWVFMGGFLTYLTWMFRHDLQQARISAKWRHIANHIDRYSRVIFPLAFAIWAAVQRAELNGDDRYGAPLVCGADTWGSAFAAA